MPRTPSCPVCKVPTVDAFKPFCSRGCRDRDLLKWFSEDYRVPAGPADGPDQKDDE